MVGWEEDYSQFLTKKEKKKRTFDWFATMDPFVPALGAILAQDLSTNTCDAALIRLS